MGGRNNQVAFEKQFSAEVAEKVVNIEELKIIFIDAASDSNEKVVKETFERCKDEKKDEDTRKLLTF